MKSKAVIERLPIYYYYLKSLQANPPQYISSATIANALQLGEVQVRKDLASICMGGKPKVGYENKVLLDALGKELGFDTVTNVVIIGAGKLGKALLEYKGFETYGLNIVAAFDVKESVLEEHNEKIHPLDDLKTFCKSNDVQIGIITTPSDQAQQVSELMVESGISAIWNFTKVHLVVPDNILVRNENMANSLAVLSILHTKNRRLN